MNKKIFWVLSFLLLILQPVFAITKQEEAKISRRERNKLMAMRGNTFGIFGWDGFENLNLDSKTIFVGCLDIYGIVIMNDEMLETICRGIADEDDSPTCPKKRMEKFERIKGNVIFVDSQGRIAPYFRPLTNEETRELYGDRVPICSSYQLDY